MPSTEPQPAPALPTDAAIIRPERFCVLVFDEQNLLALRPGEGDALPELPVCGPVPAPAGETTALANAAACEFVGAPVRVVEVAIATVPDPAGPRTIAISLCLPRDTSRISTKVEWHSLADLHARLAAVSSGEGEELRAVLEAIRPHLIRIPYLNFTENEYVFRFRTEDQRNRSVYASDERSRRLYQSALCEAIKAVKRRRERTAEPPALLDFGAVRYVLPSHFGFCLGVQNAIERAYETVAQNPGRRVFMISELIHNPFVNEDLRERGLIYLQSDRGVHHVNPATGRAWWDELQRGDIVLTPAFGATDEDKVRLIERGIAVTRHDATCMLVEKVWKAARRFALAGYSVVIHGKHEHEETKATFSNCAKFGPAIVIRDDHEAAVLGEVMLAPTRAEKLRRFVPLADRCTAGFDVERDLDRIAIVNQTTLLRNETLGIIDLLEAIVMQKFGREEAALHIHGQSRGDTLCYATQVNQDALDRAVLAGADTALVVGGRNSSNTYQLFRICEAHFGRRAYYIQSERNLLSRDRVMHYVFPAKPGALGAGTTDERPFLPASAHPTILVTGGASCPDGVIQQVISRINGFFPAAELRPVESVLADLVRDAG